jgi:hypothetical protein
MFILPSIKSLFTVLITILASKLSTQLNNKSIFPPPKRFSLKIKLKFFKYLKRKFKNYTKPGVRSYGNHNSNGEGIKLKNLLNNSHKITKIINSCNIIIMYFDFNIWIYISKKKNKL